ncbi:RAVE protein 1 C terminal-domain-containing protein [Stachybotrys elegans]|uniref:RAVE protein 1 C terminal-domain-containing protein n=1 Tax=Stachybotrys elegans TaxID=80388 RepID=A0A8K0WRU0_9HYPO|nr:RAVE protein 1 C terminal-domain-containing protein [Stachybotrys elegans]
MAFVTPDPAIHLAYNQANINLPASPPDDGRAGARSPGSTRASSEPYYTNQDITILYDIVVAAQHELENDAHPKPLPAAALFKAYDNVLPKHGIDPDDDHHLSAFIFRIGGERGDGSLLSKFQTILGRMGIVLEHSDNTTSSLSESNSPPNIVRPWDRHMPKEDGATRDGLEFSDTPSASPANDKRWAPPTAPSVASPRAVDDFDSYHDVGSNNSLPHRLAAARDQAKPTVEPAYQPAYEPIYEPEDQPENELEQESRDEPKNGEAELDPVPRPRRTAEEIRQEILKRLNHSGPDGLAAMRRATLVSALDRWRGAASTPQNLGDRRPPREDRLQTIVEVSDSSFEESGMRENVGDEHQEVQLPFAEANSVIPPTVEKHSSPLQEKSIASEVEQPPTPQNPTEKPAIVEESFSKSQLPHTPQAQPPTNDKAHIRLLKRAARARQLYLASKMFNRWADKTARRLEREAVARRHMIRFRCFRAWIQTPISASPTVDQLRSLTAVQKLRRAVAVQEEQFKKAAESLAHSYRLGVVSRVFERWSNSLLQQELRKKRAAELSSKALTKWRVQTSHDKSVGMVIVADNERFLRMQACHFWSRRIISDSIYSNAARQIYMERLAYKYLREWWQQAEARRRAETWRHHMLMDKAARAFDHWNLQARAQAFIWRNEYVAVSRVFERWTAVAQRDKQQGDLAMAHYRDRMRSRLVTTLSQAHKEHSNLTRLHSRASLYVNATKLLEVFDSAVQRRKTQEKHNLRRAIMKRYTQLSSARKKRNFFSALDTWREATRESLEQDQMAKSHKELETMEQQNAILTKWREAANVQREQAAEIDQRYAQQYLDKWANSTQQHEERGRQAWEAWVIRKQHEYLKDWSIAAMQQGGQAHTATVARHRHDREKRNVVFRYWRQSLGLNDEIQPEEFEGGALGNESQLAYRSTWRNPFASRSQARRTPFRSDDLASLLGTPTPWTGLQSNVGKGSRMDPLTEAEEVYFPGPALPEDDTSRAPRPAQGTKGKEPLALPTTTPRAPVPLHLKRVYQPQNPRSDNRGHGTSLPLRMQTGRSKQPLNDTVVGLQPVPGSQNREEMLGQSTMHPPPRPFQSQRTVNITEPSDMFAPIAYISGNAFTILEGVTDILQTIYDDDDHHLEAIALDEASGKIATCTATQVRVYKPVGLYDNALKWALEVAFPIPTSKPYFYETCSVSWGSSEELLVATSSLYLFSTKTEPLRLWDKNLPSPVKSAALSYDSAYIASVGHYDRSPKVWRRLSYGQDEVRFDFTYLRHPDLVTSIRWRKPFHIEQAAENVLYTFCLDNHVRIWIPTETVEGRHWKLWGRIDLGSSLPNAPTSAGVRIAFIVDGRDFTASVERAVQDRMSDDPSTDEVALDHLVAIANKSPEVCIAVDCAGNMAAWALENVGGDDTSKSRIFSIAQVQSRQFERLEGYFSLHEPQHAELQAYCDKRTGEIHMLLHTFDARIGVFVSNAADLLDPITNNRRLQLRNIWCGHSEPIKKVIRNFSGRAIVSRTSAGESIVWQHATQKSGSPGLALTRQSVIPNKGSIHRICVFRKGRFAVALHQGVATLWDCRQEKAVALASVSVEVEGQPLCLIILPRPHFQDYTTAHIATITSERHGVVWEVTLPKYFETPSSSEPSGMREFCRFDLQSIEDLAYVLPVDPAGAKPLVSGFLDVFARDVAISYTNSGRVEFWTARVDLEKQRVDWLSTCATDTGLSNPSLVSGSMLKKAALVNSTRSQLTIWDVGGSQLEYEADYDAHNIVQDLDWTSTPDSQSILAVGFQYRVILLAQMRFDYLNKGPAWAAIREINIRDLTPHPIGDSAWLGDGHLVVGAGHQMFIYDRRVRASDTVRTDLRLPPRKDGSWDIFEAVQRFNGPLPVFHPHFLSQCILSGKNIMVRRILLSLHKTLKFFIPGESIDDYLGIDPNDFYDREGTSSKVKDRTASAYLNGDTSADEEDESFTEQTATMINEKLTKITIPQLSGHEQIQLADIIECVSLVEHHRRSLDENGARFVLFFRQHALRKGRTNEMQLSWREINWAFHSSSQDILVDFVSRQYHGSMLWEHARESGMFVWLSDNTALRTQFEIIARNEYTKSDTKNPVDCSLFYLALRKKTVLQGLWRMATGNKEQAATQKLLANNFDDPKWKRSALKNAYALLSKRRFNYAAAFFLLADRLEDAIEICLRQLDDMQLAIAIGRVYGGDDSPVFKKLLKEDVLPLAAQKGNRWLASWAFWMLGRKDMAVRSLITPVYALVETPCSPDMKSRLFLTDDPALVVLYSQLRQQTLQTLRGASKIGPKIEWEFVLHSAKLYDRMGCDLLGLDLVRNWEFQRTSAVGLGGDMNPLKLLRRRSSLVVDDMPSAKLHALGVGLEPTKPSNNQPTTFVEPDAGSLLDSFGF